MLRILTKKWYRLFGNRNVNFQPHSIFSIKAGYHHALSAEQLDARFSTDEWQKEVYQLTNDVALKENYKTIIDIGCGSGYKLIHQLGNFDTTGIEVDPTYSFLIEKYPDRKWLLFDTVAPEKLKADLLVCADVIEHLPDPDDLLEFISAIDFKELLISTPERDAVAGKKDFGPPENTAHYREWNAIEFKIYLRQWFDVKEQHIFEGRSVTQVVRCSRKGDLKSYECGNMKM